MKILIFFSDPFSCLRFRGKLLEDLAKNNEVIAISGGNQSIWNSKFLSIGVKYINIPLARAKLKPIDDLRCMIRIANIIYKEKPDVTFSYEAKAILISIFISKLFSIKKRIVLLTGLGSIFRSKDMYFKKNIRKIIIYIYKNILKYSTSIIVHNNEDKKYLIQNLNIRNKIYMVNGSGIDLSDYQYSQKESNKFVFLFIGRLLKDKGIIEFLEAANIVKKKFPKIEFWVVGAIDDNPTSITEQILNYYINNKIIEYFGFQKDVKKFLIECSVFVLPSYHEGLSRSILEAMAIGRPIITTNAPGCRDTVKDGLNGFLIPVADVQSLVNKMIEIYNNKNKILEMGLASRNICESKFGLEIINKQMIDIILSSK